uniref:TNFR-Cys domain-containing protein n=1 Tax=Scleropages formosus TaxID=113540 RepID=A0A8C9SH11_SCLFO
MKPGYIITFFLLSQMVSVFLLVQFLTNVSLTCKLKSAANNPCRTILGFHVYKHCTEQTSTSCVPCTGSTFTDKPNSVTKCGPCTLCDHGLGLKTVKECKPSSDAVCGALEGNYCIDPYEGGCRAAKEHTTCKPGHFIKHPGTDSTDTVCEICPERSFSNGSSISCTPHTE